jgi:xanthine dehydrogenase accessory factor
MINPEIKYPYRDILKSLHHFRKADSFSETDNIILTSISSSEVHTKQIISLSTIETSDKEIPDELKLFILATLTSGKPINILSLKDGFEIETIYIVEVIRPIRSIIILGAGHVGRSLSLIGSSLGFNTILIDDREEFLSDSNLKQANITKVLSSFDNYSQSIAITSNCAIVIVTRGHQFDEICLRIAIQTNARYIGMIGSKRRVLAIKNNLRQSILTKEQSINLDNIYAPIGLSIGAKTPQEIAISILAQIIQVMNY